MEKHTISVLVENKFGVLSRVSGLFSGRGYNIESLTVNETNDPKVSKMTIVTTGDEAIIEQIDKQLNKLIDVVKVTDLTGSHFIERELILCKVKTTKENRSEVIQISEIFGAQVISVHNNELGVELSGNSSQIDDFISMMDEFGVIEVSRSGRVAISRKPGATENYSDV